MPDASTSESPDLVAVTATGIRTDSASDSPFLVLEDEENRELPIAIGTPEAAAIAFALQGVEVQRPMTHDALKQTIDALGATVRRVVVGFVPDSGTYTADVVLGMDAGEERHLDWRLSDSVALVVRCEPRPPILVPEELLARPPALTPRWPKGARIRCSCGQWMAVETFTVVEAGSSGADLVEADVECPACGHARHVRLEAPPAIARGSTL